MALERTFSIIKPDAVAKNAIGQIVGRFEANGRMGCRSLRNEWSISPKRRPKVFMPSMMAKDSLTIWLRS